MADQTAEPLIVVILVGSPEQIQRGKGEPAVTCAQAAARLGISDARLRQITKNGAIAPVAVFGKAHLYLERDVEELKQRRSVIHG